MPLLPHVDIAAAVHWPAGAAVPGLTFAQVPFVPPVSAAEQAMHVLVHAELQQNPLAQERPLVHWSVAVHGEPCPDFATQVPVDPGFRQ